MIKLKWEKFNIDDFTDDDLYLWLSYMSLERQNKINRLCFYDDRKRSVAGEMLARKLLSEYSGTVPKDIVILTDKKGKPYSQNVNLNFSISHSDKYVACAVNKTQVGIDIEKIQPDINFQITKKFCTEKEKDYIFRSFEKESAVRRFFEVWTFKEAYFKFIGTGITNLKSIDIFELDLNRSCFVEEGYMFTIIY